MKRKLIMGLLILALIAVPLFAVACEGEEEGDNTLRYRAEFFDVVCDPLDPRSVQFGPWNEALFTDDMSVDRDEFSFGSNFFSVDYKAGQLAEDWDQPDPLTIVVNLRQGVTWQNEAVTGCREFTADDVVFTYEKVLGIGEFAGQETNPFLVALMPSIESVEATGPYTVEFHLKVASPWAIYEIVNPWMCIPIAAREWFDLTEEQKMDWHNITGTGPFVITDYVSGTSMTCAANPDYYGVDPRYDDRPVPYIDELKFIVIPDMATTLSAFRTGELDVLLDARVYPTLSELQSLKETNPEIIQVPFAAMGPGIFFHWDQDTGTIDPPFDDIRVRKAMQLALDLDLIAETLYQETIPGTPMGLISPLAGDWSTPYDEWPAELQAEYSYDLETAQALMTEAAADGAFTPNDLGGFDTEILAAQEDFPEFLLAVQNMLRDIGIVMNINSMGMMEQRPVVQAGDFETLWVSMVGDTNSSPQSSIQSFYSQKFERIGQGGGVCDPAYDAFVESFFAATTEDECRPIFREAEMYFLERHWAVLTFPTGGHRIWQPWVKGYYGEHMWSTMTWTYVSHMWIDQDIKAQYVGD